jgi:hypothetical protein
MYETPGEWVFTLPVRMRPKYAVMVGCDPDEPKAGVLSIMPNGAVFFAEPGKRYKLSDAEYKERLRDC